MRNLILALAMLLAELAMAGAATAGFETFTYQGSRDDVRAYCIGETMYLSDRADYTYCEDRLTGEARTCSDDGRCLGAGYELELTTGGIGGGSAVQPAPRGAAITPLWGLLFPDGNYADCHDRIFVSTGSIGRVSVVPSDGHCAAASYDIYAATGR